MSNQGSLAISVRSGIQSDQAQQLTSGSRAYKFAWTADGQVILGQQQADLIVFHPDTGTKTPLTSPQQDGAAIQPSACANGRYVLFSMFAHADAMKQTIWHIDAGGGNLKQLTDGQDDEHPICSPDGHWVYYLDLPNARITKVPLDGGKTGKIRRDSSLRASRHFSRLQAGVFRGVRHRAKTVGGGPRRFSSEHKTRRSAAPGPGNWAVRFTHDGKAVVYALADQDSANLWLEPLDGSLEKQLTNFKSEQIIDFHWSFDGSKLGLVRGHTDADVVLLEDSKP